jgi:hypothetical protein
MTSVILAAILSASQSAFVTDDVKVSEARVIYSDPEFCDELSQMVFWDYSAGSLNAGVADLDPVTGLVKNPSGRDAIVATGLSPNFKDGKWWSHNGPEYGRDKNGWAIYFTKEDSKGARQIWRARKKEGRYVGEQLTTAPLGQAGVLVSTVAKDEDTRMMFYFEMDSPRGYSVAWANAGDPDKFNELPNWRGSNSIARHVAGASLIAYAPRYDGVAQVTLLNTKTGKTTRITDEPGEKFDTFGFFAPEFGGEMLVGSNIDRKRFAIFRNTKKDGSYWTKIAELRLPEDSPFKFIYSVEPAAPETGVNGVTYFTLNATESAQGNRGETGRSAQNGSIWVLGFGKDPSNRLVRRLDEGLNSGIRTVRYESESMLGKDELFVYYERRNPETGRGELRRCRTGIFRALKGGR